MKRVVKWLLTAVLVVVLALAALIAHTIYFKPLNLNWFYSRVFATFAFQSPELLSSLRILPGWLDFYSAELDDASPQHERKQIAQLKDDLATLQKYDRNALSAEEQLSYDTLAFFLQSQVDGEAFQFHDFPINQLHGIQSALPDFMVQIHQVGNRKDAEHYITRLNLFQQKFTQVTEGLKLRESKGIIPPHFAVEEVLEQMKGFVAKPAREHVLYTSFKEKLDKIPAAEMDDADLSTADTYD